MKKLKYDCQFLCCLKKGAISVLDIDAISSDIVEVMVKLAVSL